VELIESLQDFLAEGAWVERFDEEVRVLGGKMVSKVRGLRLDEGDGELCFSATILSEEVEGAFWEEGGGLAVETACSCEVGVFCEHGFAALGKLTKERRLERLLGRSAKEAVSLELAGKRAIPAEQANGEPVDSFELVVRKDEVDAATRLLLKSLGEAEPSEWIFAEAFVNRDGSREPLAAVGHGESPAHMRAMRELKDTGLSSMRSNTAWRFLLSMKSRSVGRWYSKKALATKYMKPLRRNGKPGYCRERVRKKGEVMPTRVIFQMEVGLVFLWVSMSMECAMI